MITALKSDIDTKPLIPTLWVSADGLLMILLPLSCIGSDQGSCR